jgi:hypothetical protein
VQDIGAFNDDETQSQYIRWDVPMPPNDPKWVEFPACAWAWFHFMEGHFSSILSKLRPFPFARYRLTSTLISLILEAGYQSP